MGNLDEDIMMTTMGVISSHFVKFKEAKVYEFRAFHTHAYFPRFN